jgi:predicted NUDIX family NTP pyrophosphohydrolase
MRKNSAGLLPYRITAAGVEVLLAHPGGPFWAKKDLGAWMIPKGEVGPGEAPLDAALREFTEETGFTARGPFTDLGALVQRGGKAVRIWAAQGDCDPAALRPGLFEMEWPPRSGRSASFPEIDRVAWFALAEAETRILASQRPFLQRLEARLAADGKGRNPGRSD